MKKVKIIFTCFSTARQDDLSFFIKLVFAVKLIIMSYYLNMLLISSKEAYKD